MEEAGRLEFQERVAVQVQSHQLVNQVELMLQMKHKGSPLEESPPVWERPAFHSIQSIGQGPVILLEGNLLCSKSTQIK